MKQSNQPQKVGITKRQKEVLEAIEEYIRVFGYSPSYDELARSLGTKKGSLARMIGSLVDRGYLIKGEKGHARTLSIAAKPNV